jgi:hypothetical protein
VKTGQVVDVMEEWGEVLVKPKARPGGGERWRGRVRRGRREAEGQQAATFFFLSSLPLPLGIGRVRLQLLISPEVLAAQALAWVPSGSAKARRRIGGLCGPSRWH